jgi:hypothetical protein
VSTTASVLSHFSLSQTATFYLRRFDTLYHAVITLSRPSRAECRIFLRSGKLPRWSGCDGRVGMDSGVVGRLEVPGRTAESLQSHHTPLQIRDAMPMATSDAIRSVSLEAFRPARQYVHTRSSVVAGPCRVNMLARCPFAAYSMLRGLTCKGWPCWRARLALLIRLERLFREQCHGRTRRSRPSPVSHKC